ncbi:MAG: mucoidy inhibitor MuiA family protein [Deltaproteobacteria bacterium]|jgi:uncharacterized protein (TIGR02231 family)
MSNAIHVEAPVVAVTLHEDRAHVTRSARIELPAGRSSLRVEGLAPVLADKTLTAKLEGAAVLLAKIDRRVVVDDADRNERERTLRKERDRHEREVATHGRALARLRARQRSLETMENLELDELVQDAAWDRLDTATAHQSLERLDTAARQLIDEIAEANRVQRRLDERTADLDARAAAIATPASKRRAAATVLVDARQAGVMTFVIEYVVPAACWRPHHRAVLEDGVVRWAMDASVWQNTGEDWNDVALAFSTERPSLGSSPPPLFSDVVQAVKKGPEIVETREQSVETTGLGRRTTKEMNDVPGIDDGGDPMHIDAAARATIPSDGRPHRVPIHTFESPADASLVLMGELAPAVILKTRLDNTSDRALLPGPVDLVRDSGLVGRTSIEYVAEGERFELGWGPDAELRVAREVRELEEEKRVLSRWTKTPYVVEVHVSNIGTAPKRIEVTERVIVSEVERVKLKVLPAKTTERATPDDDGFVRWTLDLPGGSRRRVKLTYLIEQHDAVVSVARAS